MDEGTAAALSNMMNSASQTIQSAGYGIAGAQMSKADRKAQERWMKMQREWALEDWNRNIDYQREMWNQSVNYDAREYDRRFWQQAKYNEEYNSPRAQMNRMRQAGINPYYAASQMNPGNVTGSVSGPGIQSSTAPSVNSGFTIPGYRSPFMPDFAANPADFMDSLIKAEQHSYMQEETKGKRLENLLDLGSLADKLESQRMSNEEKRKRMPYIENFLEQELRSARAAEENTIANTALAYQSANTQIENVTLAKRQFELAQQLQQFNIQEQLRLDDATINKIAAEINNLSFLNGVYGSQQGLLKAQTGQVYVNTLFDALKTEGVRLDNDQKKALSPFILRQAKNEEKLFGEQYWYEKAKKYNPFYWVGQGLGGTMSGAGNLIKAIK